MQNPARHASLVAYAAMLHTCSVRATDEKPILAFYVLSPEKIEGGRFINTKAFPKLGHIAAKPALVITPLKEARLFKQPGDQPNILITLQSNQVEQLADFTSKNVGKKFLLMLGNEPLIAPRVLKKIRTPALQISLSEEKKRTRILKALKQLIEKPKH